MRKFQQSLFSLALLPIVVTSGGIGDWGLGTRDREELNKHSDTNQILTLHLPSVSKEFLSQSPISGEIVAGNTLIGSIPSIWGNKPRRRLVSRSLGVCAISPGLVETYFVWSDRPLFLWYSSGVNKIAQLIVRDPATAKVVWTQTVNITDQKVFYNGEKTLEPGKRYQWQVLGNDNMSLIPPSTFQIMAVGDRDKIQTDLQALEKKLKANKIPPEEIALQKADYFLNYQITHQTEAGIFHLWSDALEILYKVDKPSPSFIEKRQAKVEDLCK
jgi:hypothetical protein